MFKKGPDIDKKKLLAKASDVKRDSLSRLKYFKTLIEHLDHNETHSLFKSHFSFIYHTFIDTFSTFDCNFKQRRDDLECILFIFEKIIICNPELIKKRWQFYSITFVMQKLLHQNNTWQLRQEGVRLFVLWYQILCDDQNAELQRMFGSLVPNVVPLSSLPVSSPATTPAQQSQQTAIHHQSQCQQSQLQQQQPQNPQTTAPTTQPKMPIKPVEPLVPKSPNEHTPTDEPSFYLDNLLQFMVTQTTKPFWTSPDEAKKNQELGFSFIFNMFKEFYLPHLFPNLSLTNSYVSRLSSSASPSFHLNHSKTNQYVDATSSESASDIKTQHYRGSFQTSSTTSPPYPQNAIGARREPLQLDLRNQQNYLTHLSSPSSKLSPSVGRSGSSEQERSTALSSYQAIVIKWLTRILRQDLIPGQDELIRTGAGSSTDRRDGQENARELSSAGQNESEYTYADANSTGIFQGIESSSREMEIARRVIGTWPDNIAVVHELFRRAFLTFQQPASMKRVVNVYKEWICNGGPNQQANSNQSAKSIKIGYTSFNDLLQIFVRNSSNAFLTRVHNSTMLDEQFEMCKRIMNIYRYMVMKIYMNTSTWEQLLNVMLMITEQLFPVVPPERKESTIGGRIAPAFFQTFIVSWIRANLYVHISTQMWHKFHGTMIDLIKWRELVEEWSTTMGSLTRVLVKHVYGLSLTDLPLDRPQERRRRPKTLKSFSTAEAPAPTNKSPDPSSPSSATAASSKRTRLGAQRPPRSGSVRLPSLMNQTKELTRSNSDGVMFQNARLYYNSSAPRRGSHHHAMSPDRMRKIKSEYLILASDLSAPATCQDDSVMMAHNDAIDGASLKDSMIIEHDQTLDSHHSGKSSMDSSMVQTSGGHKTTAGGHKSRPESRLNADKCVLLGGSVRGWTSENSIIMWRRMLGLFGNINQIEDPDNHLIAIKCLEVILNDFTKTRENLGISLDNQSTPEQPSLVPPYTFPFGWLLEATHLPRQYKESRLLAYKLLCAMSIRRHDIELSQQYYVAFFEALHRGLSSPDPSVHAVIIQNSARLLSFELPGCSFLVQSLFERARAILLSSEVSGQPASAALKSTRDEAVQILAAILSLNRPIKKLMVLKSEPGGNTMNLVAPGDIKAKVFDTLLACNTRPLILDSQTRCKALSSLAIHVYQLLCDKSDGLEVEKLFDSLLTELQSDASNAVAFRLNCDLVRVFADHGASLSSSRPAFVSSLIQILSQLIVRLSTDEGNKEAIQYLLICLEDWCMAVNKAFLAKPVEQFSATEEDDTLSMGLNDSLMTIVLRSLESVIYDEQFADDASNRTTMGSKASDTQSSGRQSQGKISSGSGGSHRDRTLTNNEAQQAQHSAASARLGGQQHQVSATQIPSGANKNLEAIKLACKVYRLKLITYLGHFPFKQVGSASMSCLVSEFDYLATSAEQQEQQQADLKNTPGLVILVIDGSTIISFIGAAPNPEDDGLCQPIHLIVRNLCGKYSWDASCLEADASSPKRPTTGANNEKGLATFIGSDAYLEATSRSSMKYDSDFNEDGNSTSSLSSRSSLSRDCIGDLLNHLSCSLASANGSSISSSSCQNMQRSKRNSAQSVSNPKLRVAQAEETMIALLTNQRFQELNYCEKSDDTERINLSQLSSKQVSAGRLGSIGLGAAGDHSTAADSDHHRQKQRPASKIISFEQCRQLIQQLGYLSWEKRCKIDSLAKSARLARELKNLDAQPGRETHKIAVIYVAQGQEDKVSILSNSSGSRAYNDFVSGLGWDVDLGSHLGFKGGLQSNKSTGDTSVYYCNASTEVMFHVSTRIPVNKPLDDESLNRKLRHLGNDEIHIVWSEHVRDYRRGIIPTEFGDIIIAIYPMLTFQGYYRVQISCKPDVPLFGPLFDNCLVHHTSLAPLVRATAINASRAKRLNLPYFQSHFEERNRLIELMVQNHREKLSFEEFALQLYTRSSSRESGAAASQDPCCAG